MLLCLLDLQGLYFSMPLCLFSAGLITVPLRNPSCPPSSPLHPLFHFPPPPAASPVQDPSSSSLSAMLYLLAYSVILCILQTAACLTAASVLLCSMTVSDLSDTCKWHKAFISNLTWSVIEGELPCRSRHALMTPQTVSSGHNTLHCWTVAQPCLPATA